MCISGLRLHCLTLFNVHGIFSFCWSVILPYNVHYFYIIPGVLVGNKTDLEDRRVITTEAAKSLAQGNGMEYFECSAVSLCSSYCVLKSIESMR